MVNTKSVLVFSVAALAAAFSFAFAASIFDIEYPIPELGNCADRLECKTYCNNPDNSEACFEFAKKYGLVDSKTEEKIKRVQSLQKESGPGGCNSRESCEEYCNNPDHAEECIDDSMRRGFMSKEEGARAKKMAKGGPGGCRGDACRVYCNDSAHEDECFEFAADNGFIEKKEVERIRGFKKTFGKKPEGPGGCKNERECRTYCDEPDHIEECLDFAEKNGLIKPEDAQKMKRIGLAGGPGGCKGERACREYCDNPDNQKECIDFAEREGLMSPEEVKMARKVSEKGGPGGCRGPKECQQFCDNPDNAEMCLVHAEQEGLMPKEELERARKFLNASKDGGPGGCKGRQCEDYCGNPEHQDECFEFAKKQGLIRPEDERNFEVGKKLDQKMRESGGPGGCKNEQECRHYCTNPDNVEECVAFASAHAGVSREDSLQMLRDFTERRFGPPRPPGPPGGGPRGPMMDLRGMPPGDFDRFEEEAMRRFDEFRLLEENFRGGGEGGFPGISGFSQPGPGGDGGFSGEQHSLGPKGPGFGPPSGGEGGRDGPQYMVTGPGGCTSPDECIKYCVEHKEECFNFGPPGRPQVRPPEGGVPPGRDFGTPQLRGNLFNEFRQNEQQSGMGGGGGSASVRITKDNLGGVKLFIRDPNGIKSFTLEPTGGSRYSGDVSGCSREFSSEPSFDAANFPMKATVVDCSDDTFETTLRGFKGVGQDRQQPQQMDFRRESEEGTRQREGFQQPPVFDIRKPEVEAANRNDEYRRLLQFPPMEDGRIPQEGYPQQFQEEFQRQYEGQFQQEMNRQMQQMPIGPKDGEFPADGYFPQRPMIPLDAEREQMMAPRIPTEQAPTSAPAPATEPVPFISPMPTPEPIRDSAPPPTIEPPPQSNLLRFLGNIFNAFEVF